MEYLEPFNKRHVTTEIICNFEKYKAFRDMFTSDELEACYNHVFATDIKSRCIDSIQEKCYAVLCGFWGSPMSDTAIETLGIWDLIKNTDIPTIFEYVIRNKPKNTHKSQGIKERLREITAPLEKDKEAFSEFLLFNGLSEDNYKMFIEELTNQDSLWAYLFAYKKHWRTLLNIIYASYKCNRYEHKRSLQESELCEFYYRSQLLYKEYPHLVQKIESTYSFEELNVLPEIIMYNNPEEEKDAILAMVMRCCVTYQSVYSTDWQNLCFRYLLDLMGEEQKINFVRFLNLSVEEGGSPYVEDYCEAMEKYCIEKGINPVIALNLVSRRNKPLVRDKTNTEDYVRVLNSKLKDVAKDSSDEDKVLYSKLKKLHGKLKEKGYISEDTDRDLFIYRLSGLNRPDDHILSKKIKIKGRNNTNLGYVLRCLCSDDQKDFSKTILNGFFCSDGGKDVNFACKYLSPDEYKMEPGFAEAVNLLQEDDDSCGFTSCEIIYNGKRPPRKKK